MTTTRALAVATYLAAVAAPASADWRTVADQLYAALPATRKALATAVDSAAPASAPRWYADWKLGKVYSLDSVAVTFADGVTVRVNLAKAPGKLPRVAASCRTAVAFYRAHTGRDTVPAFASIITASDGAEFDAEACSRLTADIRRTAIVPRAVRPAVTAEAVARMVRELERRRAGLARAEARDTAGQWAGVADWARSVEAGEAELAAMRAVLDGAEPAPAVLSPLAVAAIAAMASCEPEPRVEVEQGGPQALLLAEPAPADNDDAPVSPMPGAPAPAVAPISANAPVPTPVEEIGMVAPVEAIAAPCDHLEPMALCPAVGMPCRLSCGFRSGCGRPVAEPLDAIEAEPLAALCSDDDAPSVVGPVTVLCLSMPARVAVIERVGMRAIPSDAKGAKHGSFRLSVDDAQACEGIRSVRFIGLPRKPYVRAAAPGRPPVEAIRIGTPVEAILRDVAPRSWVHPIIAGLARPPVVLHAASKL